MFICCLFIKLSQTAQMKLPFVDRGSFTLQPYCVNEISFMLLSQQNYCYTKPAVGLNILFTRESCFLFYILNAFPHVENPILVVVTFGVDSCWVCSRSFIVTTFIFEKWNYYEYSKNIFCIWPQGRGSSSA